MLTCNKRKMMAVIAHVVAMGRAIFPVLLLFPLLSHLYASEPPSSDFSLSGKPVRIFFSAGKKTGNTIRWFAQDDFGLMDFLNDIREKKIKLSSPYRLLPPGKDFLFVGIDAGMSRCQAQEVIDFAMQGNLAVLLLSPGKFADYKKEITQKMPGGEVTDSASGRVIRIDAGEGAVVLIDDPFAFCNARFGENRVLWNSLLKGRNIKAVRIVQRDCYARSDRTIFVTSPSGVREIEPKQETDPAFAPSFTDSNREEEFYKMTQLHYFLSEKYFIDGEEIKDWKSMMRVRSYDNFVPPDADNPEEWHFSISDPHSSPVQTTETIPAGFVKLKVQTGVTEKVPPNSITLASLSPGSKLLSVRVYSVEVFDKKRKEALKQELDRRKASAVRKAPKKDQTPPFSIVKTPSKQETSSTAASTRSLDTETQELQREYDDLEKRERLIGKGRPGQVLSNVQASVKRDKSNNWTVQLKPPECVPVFVVYEVALPEIFFRRDGRDFRDELIPDDLSVRELCRQQRAHGIDPCPVPQHEKDALKRMIGKERFPWFMQGSVSSGRYLPRQVEEALQGKDIPVKELFHSLSDYAKKDLKDCDVILKDEFNSFHEAMLYWQAGVCRHRARLGYMILNTLGITARCVTTREHAYVEVYLPFVNNGKGGWTYLDFGGGPGAKMPEIPFEEIPLQPGSLPLGGPPPGGPASPPDPLPPGPGDSMLSIPLLAILSILFCAAVILFVLRRLRQKRLARAAMPFEGDFMASCETILANEINDQEFASAALILLEAATPQMLDSALPQIRNWQCSIRDSMHCSKRQYWKIVDFIRKNQRNKTKGEN